MRAALIATGNEIVSGQTLNTNSSHLAEFLSDQGLEVAYHFAVLDSEDDIKEILSFIKSKGIEHIFMIGGLGPTRDDLTRKIIADFFKRDFVFRPDLWTGLEKLLSDRVIKAREGHKWQCYFPKGSEVLINSVGTAHGFRTFDEDLSIWCLPGPPQELRSVYHNGIEPWLKENIHAQTKLLTWQCIEVPESELAHQIEGAFDECEYELGFRASPPIVEVKLWVPISEESSSAKKWIEKIDEITKPYLYSTGGQNYFREVLDESLKKGAITLKDEISGGFLFESLMNIYKGNLPKGLSLIMGEIEPEMASSLLNLSVYNEEASIELGMYKETFRVDPVKMHKSKRYRRTLCAKLFKALHGKILLS